MTKGQRKQVSIRNQLVCVDLVEWDPAVVED
jgi:hypothetical protein